MDDRVGAQHCGFDIGPTQHIVHERDGNRALSDRRRNPLHVPAAHVAYGEDAWTAGLEQMRRSRQRPVRRQEVRGREIRTGLDEPFVIERDASVSNNTSPCRTSRGCP
ncbi:MAG TPA: hypothetical protein VFT47_21550 [Vicinamibacterales bacterium]|nr:hypothetical protein [Vicinamibacterales bacterium]